MGKKDININKLPRISYEDIIKDGNPILREVSQEVTWPLNKEDLMIMNQMIDYVRSSQNNLESDKRNLRPAYGISAVQLGHLKKMMYIRIENNQGFEPEEFALINPRIIEQSKKQVALSFGEGCLSIEEEIPGYVLRSHSIKMIAIDHFTDREVEIEAHGLTSIVLQHEMDHLSGILFYDRINKLNPKKIDPSVKLV
ncbi:MAG: peptide deformylase 2 [Candidatus Tyloplasma litorale]|nr:MAG: peptide deformylase 2 [Mycoplasmatales bacterium]